MTSPEQADPVQSDQYDIQSQTMMINSEVMMMRQEHVRLTHERQQMTEKIADNMTKIKQNKVLPYLVSKVVEVSFLIPVGLAAETYRFSTSTRRIRRVRRTTSRMLNPPSARSSRHRQDRSVIRVLEDDS